MIFRNKFYVCLIVLITTVFLVAPGSALGFEKTATTGATFLQIPVGSRLPSMAGAGVAYAGYADMIASNPAAAVGEKGIGVSVSYLDWFAGLRHQSASLIVPLSPGLHVGFHAINFTGDEFEQTTLTAQEGNGIMVNYSDLAVGASGIAQLTDRFTVGVTGKLIRQTLFHTSASTFAFDIGTLLNTSLKGFSIGMSMRNLGGEMQLDGRDLIMEPGGVSGGETRLATSSWQLPLTFQTGVAWRITGNENAFVENQYHGSVVVLDARHLNEGKTTLHMGVEYGFGETVFIRSGQTFGHDTETWSFGGGVRVKVYQYVVVADMAYADLGDLESVKRVTLSLVKRQF